MDVKSDGTMKPTQSLGSSKNEEINKKTLRSDSGISLENVDNQENLDKYNDCEKKMDKEILVNLLKNVQKSLPSSGCSSEDEEFPSKLKVNYKSLIEALSSCNKDEKIKVEKRDVKTEKVVTEKKTSTEKVVLEKRTSSEKVSKEKKSNRSEISDINEIFGADKKKNHRGSSKTVNTSNNPASSALDTDKLSSAAIMEQLSAKISSMNLAKKQKSKTKHKDDVKTAHFSKEEKDNKTSREKNDGSATEVQKKKDKKYSIFLERGPWSKPKSHTVRNDNPFYQKNHQLINTNILSGGKCWATEEPVDFIPKTIPDFEGLLAKPVPKDDFIDSRVPGNNNAILDDSLSPTAIAAVLEKEVLSFTNGVDSDKQNLIEEPNWGDYELVKNILEREAGNCDILSDANIQPPTIVVDGCGNQEMDSIAHDTQTTITNDGLNELHRQTQHFIVQSPSGERLHEVSYGCQRMDQLTPTSQSAAFSFDSQTITNEMNNLPQNFELPPTPTDIRSPMQLYSPADSSLSLKVPHSSSNFYSPSPSIYSVNNGSPEQTFITESPRYSNTPNLDQEFLGINNALLNQTAFSDTFPDQMSSPNDSFLRSSSRSNRSSFCGSDYFSDQCFSSPNAEPIENQSCDNIYELTSPLQCRRTNESFSSSSPLESPEIFLNPEELDSITYALSQNVYTEQIQSYPENSNDICLQLYSVQNQSLKYSQENGQDLKSQTYMFHTKPLNNNLPQNNGILPPTLQNSQPVPKFEQKNMKCTKVKPIQIAAKQSYPCCVKLNKSAREILEEMFQRLDENMQSNVLLKVHTLDDNNLMKLLDSLLAGWSCAKLPIPRLPLLYAICERMLMTKTTMMKFFKTYGNGHTVLDRALLTCPQSPVLTKYIAECSIKAIGCLEKDRDIVIDKTDSAGNSILHRAVCAGVDCATPLAYLLQLNADGSLLDVNRLNAEGYSPLHLACSIHVQQPGGQACSCLIMSHILLEHGNSNPNIKDPKSGVTALHTAVTSNGCSASLVTLLLKYGADPSIRNYYSCTPLDLAKSACRSSSNLQSAKQVVDILKKLKKSH